MKDGFFAAMIAAITSTILWGLNYCFLEKPKYDLETKKIELDKKKTDLERRDKEASAREEQIKLITNGDFLVKIENVKCQNIQNLDINMPFVTYSCSFKNKSKYPVSSFLEKKDFYIEQFNNMDGTYKKYSQHDDFISVDEIENASTITNNGTGKIRFRLSAKNKNYKIGGFALKGQIFLTITFKLNEEYISTTQKIYPDMNNLIKHQSELQHKQRL